MKSVDESKFKWIKIEIALSSTRSSWTRETVRLSMLLTLINDVCLCPYAQFFEGFSFEATQRTFQFPKLISVTINENV